MMGISPELTEGILRLLILCIFYIDVFSLLHQPNVLIVYIKAVSLMLFGTSLPSVGRTKCQL